MQTNQQLTLKITFEKDIRRLTVNSNLTWDELQETLRNVLKTRTPTQWNNTLVRYADDEGDLCTVRITLIEV
jgi:hypothetical protein